MTDKMKTGTASDKVVSVKADGPQPSPRPSEAAPSDVAAPAKPAAKPAPNLHLLLGTDDGLAARKREPAAKGKIILEKAQAIRLKKPMKLRHLVIALSFVLCVALPASAVSLYMAFIAVDQYHSSTSFSVRSIEGPSSGDLLGIFSQASGSSTVADSFILIDYIRSEEMLREVERNFDLEKIFGRRGGDFFYSMRAGLPIEDKLEYWRRMVHVTFDHASGIMTLELKAFDAADAQKLTDFIVDRSERLINDLSNKARDQILYSAREELQVAENRLAKARSDVRQYRDLAQEVDPVEGATLAAKLISGLEAKLTELNTTLATARKQMSEESPRIKVMKAEIDSIKAQIETERQRLGSGSADEGGSAAGDVAGRIERYQGLQTEQEFAERAYTAAMSALEKARIEASGKERYLATFIQPTLSEEAQYPRRILNSVLALLACLFAWSVGVMIYYNIRDRA